MNKLLGVILLTVLAGIIGTAGGGCITLFIKQSSKKAIGILEGFASGITLGTVCFHFISEAMHTDGGHEHSNAFAVIFCLILGYAVVFLFDLIISKRLHHDHGSHSGHACRHCEGDRKSLIMAGVVMVFSVALHNIPVGMIIGTSSHVGKEFITTAALTTAFALIIHNIPEGMAIAVPFVSGGVKKPFAILITAAAGASTVIGGITGYELGTVSPMALTTMLALAAGAMLFVIFNELIPEALSNCRPRAVSLSIILGLAVSMVIVFGGTHAH